VDPVIAPEVALIVVLPTPALVAKPLLPIAATAGCDDVHVTELLMSWLVLSENDPVATNSCVRPSTIAGFAGVTAIETRFALVTVNTVEPPTEPTEAVIVLVPLPKLVAKPSLPRELLTVAAAGLDELQ
jgi:hypothetical protein